MATCRQPVATRARRSGLFGFKPENPQAPTPENSAFLLATGSFELDDFIGDRRKGWSHQISVTRAQASKSDFVRA